MSRPILLDTCAVIWIAEDAPVSEAAIAAMDDAYDAGTPVYVSPISAWEVGFLASRGHWKSTFRPERWFSRFLGTPGIALAEMSPDVLIASSFLPGGLHRDPADRIIAATARELGLTVMTRDRALLAYAEEGHIGAIAC